MTLHDKTLNLAALNARLNRESTRVCLAGLCAPRPRIGVRSFNVFMEHRHFQPHIPELNQLYQLLSIRFHHNVFATCIFPRRYLDTADALLASLGLKCAGVPIATEVVERVSMIASTRKTGLTFAQFQRESGYTWEMFPLNGPNVFALENVDRHFTYENNPVEYEKAQQAEDEAIQREIDAYKKGNAAAIAKLQSPLL